MHWVALLILVSSSCCLCCSPPWPWKPRSLTDRARKAKVVIYGKVVPKNKENHKQRGLYKVKFEVFCVLKGRRVPRFITVSGFGHEPGLCTNSPALVNRTYIAFLKPKSHSWKLYKADEINVQPATMEVKNTKKVRRLLSNLKTIPVLPKDSNAGDSLMWGCNADLGYPYTLTETPPTSEQSSIASHKRVTVITSSENSIKDDLLEKALLSSSTHLSLFSLWVSFAMMCLSCFVPRLVT